MMNFTVGLTGVYRAVVTDEDTAAAMGNPGVHVLATPRLILFCEMAAYNAIAGEFDAETSSVGTHNDIYHLAATPVGEAVEITAVLKEIDRKRLVFEVTGHDERNPIVRGVHERFLVNLEDFLSRLPPPKR